ncbi:PLP-dependent aspartate aminotransferase family protein [Selenomonas sp. AE3005]|uniref:trans-sulfuration enzyme family protein n=1 Tax=Selenomonas sp. AE3005 TaxID=1485543 RepID=UPI0025D5D712|nr:PLP-dependent aspartate aminotransferase family protein [Selenomonas sp. AE3005]
MQDFTLEVHGCHEYDKTGAISEPIYLSATFRHPAFGQSTGYDYGRVANPTRENLEKSVAMLEQGERCWAVSSGMAAINLVLKLFKPGDHVLLSEDLYGGTVRLANDIYSHYGIEFEFVDTTDMELVSGKIRANTKGLFIETPSNPMMLISDIKALAQLAHANDAWLIVDNTFLSPHFQKPITLGADIVVHSGTKYLCGHNDVIAGFLIVADKEGAAARRVELLAKSEGPNLSTFDSWLMLRSLKTLGLRVEKQAENALAIAKWLQKQPRVTAVYYPGLPEHPGFALQSRQAAGFGGMVSFKVTSAELAKNVLARLKLIAFAESLGGVESLLTYPLAQTHAEMPQELLARTGLDDKLLRLSVGIEAVADLIADLQQALEG